MPELLHPRMADVYREKVGEPLPRPWRTQKTPHGAPSEAHSSACRGHRPEPEGDELKIDAEGRPGGMLSAARDSKRSPETGDLLVQIKLVAGAGFEPATFGL